MVGVLLEKTQVRSSSRGYSITNPGLGSYDLIKSVEIRISVINNFLSVVLHKGMATHLGETVECSSQKSLKARIVIFCLLLNNNNISKHINYPIPHVFFNSLMCSSLHPPVCPVYNLTTAGQQ